MGWIDDEGTASETLVVASNLLETVWTEFSIVQFHSSTLATISSMIDEVGLKLARGSISATSNPSDSQIAQWLVRGKQEFAKTKAYTWRRRYVTTTTTIGVYRYAMPADYDGGRTILRDKTNDTNIKIISNSRFDDMFPDVEEESNAEPSVATIKSFELWIAPPPNGVYTLEMEYMRSGDDSATGDPTDYTWIPEPDRWLIVDFAVGEAMETLQEMDKAGWYRQKYGAGVSSARRSDTRRKWSASEKRAKNIFQAN